MSEPHLHFFCGCDPAPSDGQNSDDGAIVIAGAQPKLILPDDKDFTLSNRWTDWKFRFCYARRLTSKERASARQWSGVLHDLHQRFNFSRMVMDPNGGGVMVMREMIQPVQLIHGQEVNCRPIGDQVRGPSLVSDGDFILHLWKRPDPKEPDPAMELLFPGLKGDDLLNQSLYSALKDGLDLGGDTVELPPDPGKLFATRADETRAWGEERTWALKNLQAFVSQAQNVFVKMKADGEAYEMTRNGAKQFDCAGKKDLVSAAMYAWVAFLLWLALGEFETSNSTDEGNGFRAW